VSEIPRLRPAIKVIEMIAKRTGLSLGDSADLFQDLANVMRTMQMGLLKAEPDDKKGSTH
jgi:hypothetical protein